MLYNIVDRIYIGHIPGSGSLALTGVGVCLPIIMVVSAFAALVGSGGAPRASIFMGKMIWIPRRRFSAAVYGSDHHFCDPDSSLTVVWPLHALDFLEPVKTLLTMPLIT